MTRSVPERWQSYKPFGTIIEGTRILAFKVPLKEAVAKNLSPHKRFTPETLMKAFPNLKYVVDLTNTFRYYDPKSFNDAGVKHMKIMIPGKEVPPLEGVKKFFKAMEVFESTAKSGELIGVHCTHGINRTGYLICRYLVQQLNWEPQKSVKAFEEARGYPIERGNYVTALMKVPRTKFDVSSVSLDQPNANNSYNSKFSTRQPMRPGPMAPPQFGPHRRGFANGRPPFLPPPHPQFGFGGPPPPPRAFGPRPPIPPPPPSPMARLYGPRPHAYGMLPMRPPLPPPGPGPFPGARFPPRMAGPPGPPRLPPPPGPPSRLPGPGMGPPRLPPPGMGPPRLPPPGMGPGMGPPRIPPPGLGPGMGPGMGPLRMPPPGMGPPRMPNIRKSMGHLKREVQGYAQACERGVPLQGNTKVSKDVDFTVDTFDENLTTTVCP